MQCISYNIGYYSMGKTCLPLSFLLFYLDKWCPKNKIVTFIILKSQGQYNQAPWLWDPLFLSGKPYLEWIMPQNLQNWKNLANPLLCPCLLRIWTNSFCVFCQICMPPTKGLNLVTMHNSFPDDPSNPRPRLSNQVPQIQERSHRYIKRDRELQNLKSISNPSIWQQA